MSPDSQEADVPFGLQQHLLDTTWRDSLCWLSDLIIEEIQVYDDGERSELHLLADNRLRDGYKAYGSEMYTWSPEERRRNVLEELA
ncbi:MAG: hypothetical protein ABFE07_09170, partial [Armatimonadia bacterium]